MRRLCVFLLSVAFLLAASGGVANAESQTLDGSGDITKMKVVNGANALTVTVFGLGPRCGGAQYLHVSVFNRNDRLLYEAEGDCISAQWGTGLYYTSTGVREDLQAVDCANFAFTRNSTSGAYQVKMPRSCLDNAPDRVKVASEGANYGTMTGGSAGPTKVLNRD